MKRLSGTTICLLTTGLYLLAAPGPDPRKKRILFLVDGSSSMSYNWQTGTRFKAAATIINEIMDSVQKADPEVQFALRVFGHQYPAKDKVCSDTRLEVPFNLGNRGQIQVRMNNIQPVGSSPIAYSLQQLAENDLVQSNVFSYGIILITDGQESCGGDICNSIEKYLSDKFFFKPQIIGLLPDKTLAEYYACAGEYTPVTNPDEVRTAISKITAFERYVKPVVVEKTVPKPALPDIKPAPKAVTPSVNLQSPAIVPATSLPEKERVSQVPGNTQLTPRASQPVAPPKAQPVTAPGGSKTDIDKLISEEAPEKTNISSISTAARKPTPVNVPRTTVRQPVQVKLANQPIPPARLDELIAAETPPPAKTDISQLSTPARSATPLPAGKSPQPAAPQPVKLTSAPVNPKLDDLIAAETPPPEKATIATVTSSTKPQPVRTAAPTQPKAPAPGPQPSLKVPETMIDQLIVAELPPIEKSTISPLTAASAPKPKPTAAPAVTAPKPVTITPARITDTELDKLITAELPPVVKQDIASLPPAGRSTPLRTTATTPPKAGAPIPVPAAPNEVDKLIQESIAESRTTISDLPGKTAPVLLTYAVKPPSKPATRKMGPSGIPARVGQLIEADTPPPPPPVAAQPATPAPTSAPASSDSKIKITKLPEPEMRMQAIGRPGKLTGPGQLSQDVRGGKPEPVKVDITGMDKKKAVLNPDVISGTVTSNLDNQTKLLLYLKDKTGQYYQSAPQVALKDAKSGQIKYSFARKMDPRGEPIPYMMPAGGFYDVNIMGIQAISAKGINIENGKTNKLYLTIDGARLSFAYSKNPKRTPSDLSVKVWLKGTDSSKAVNYTADEARYFEPGEYEIEVNTYPITRVTAKVSFGEEARVDVPEAGKLEITNTQTIGNGRLAVIENGQPRPITTMVLNGNPVSQQLSLLPGTYAIAYNPDPSNPNTEDNYVMFEIRSNTSTQLKLPVKQ